MREKWTILSTLVTIAQKWGRWQKELHHRQGFAMSHYIMDGMEQLTVFVTSIAAVLGLGLLINYILRLSS